MTQTTPKPQKRASSEYPGDASFRTFVDYVIEHHELPDMQINGNMGEHHKNALLLRTKFIEKGCDGFMVALSTMQKNDIAVNRALSMRPVPQEKPVGILMSDISPEKISWLWRPRLALGKMTMLDGDPGLGKSILTMDLAARVTRGRSMPGEATPGLKGGVVLITPEDGLADTIQPRLARAGADLTKVVSIGTIPETTEDGFTYNRPFTLPGDLSILEQAIQRVGAVLVIIDPLMAILGTKDTYKDNEVRAILSPLQMLIEKTQTGCILVRHLTKGGGDNAIYRGGGSIAFSALARTALMVVKDPTDESRNVLSHIKSNINTLGIGLTYTVASDEEQGDDRPYVVWGETTSMTPSELLSIPRKNTGGNRQQIVALLQEHAPKELTIAEIAEQLPDITMTNLKTTLKRMYDNGDIGKSERGSYHAT